MSFHQQSEPDVQRLQLLANTPDQKFELVLCADKIYAGDVSTVEDALKILFTTPGIFEKMLFRIGLNFTNIEHSNTFIPEFYWKSDIAYFRWFHQLSRIPAILFFLNNPETRFYVLTGEMLADKSLEVYSTNDLVAGWDNLEADQRNEILNLVIENAISLIKFGERFCFKAEKYVDRLIEELNLPFTYEEIYQKYCNSNDALVTLNYKNVA